MKALKTSIIIGLLFAFSSTAWAATQYGTALVEKGEMLILRQGKKITIKPENNAVPINEEDLLRVRPQSKVTLTSNEKASIELGSNAVFHVKPWEDKKDKGFARMLFGKFRAAVKGLTGGERFNVKTATAVVGVKGTEYLSWVGPQGQTMIIGRESTPELTGLVGPTQPVTPNQISVAGYGIPASKPVTAPPEVQRELSETTLDSPSVNTNAANLFPAQAALIREGIITQEQVDKAKEETASVDPLKDILGDTPKIDYDLDDAKENLFRAKVEVDF